MKKIMAFILILIISFATPIFANENQKIIKNIEFQNEDDVKLVYEAYKEVKKALDDVNYASLEIAVDAFYEVVDVYNEFGEEEMSSLATLLGLEDVEI